MTRTLALSCLPILAMASCAASPDAQVLTEPDPPCIEIPAGFLSEVVALQHQDAQKLAAILNELLDECLRAANLRLQGSGGCVLMKPDALLLPPPPPEPTARIVPLPRTHSVLVIAGADDMPHLLELIERLDAEPN